MKVLDLQCHHGHTFEGWFASENDFQSQCERSLVQCPVCTSADVVKKLSAPRLSLSGHTESTAELAPHTSEVAVRAEQFTAALVSVARQVMANTTDVGSRFAEEARKIHYGEAESRNIRGNTTPQEARALAEEGIEVVSLALPEFVKETLQ